MVWKKKKQNKKKKKNKLSFNRWGRREIPGGVRQHKSRFHTGDKKSKRGKGKGVRGSFPGEGMGSWVLQSEHKDRTGDVPATTGLSDIYKNKRSWNR